MAPVQPNPAPQPAPLPPDQVKRIADQTQDQVLNKSTMETLLGATVADLIAADGQRELIKGTENDPCCWYHAPARLEFSAAADKRLTRIALLDGINVKHVDRIDAKLIKGTKLMIIKAARADNLDTFRLNRYKSKTTPSANVLPLTGPDGLTMETGYREMYDVAYVPKASPLWPALVIDLGKPLERRAVKNKSAKKQDGANPNPQTQAEQVAAAENKPSA